MSALLELALANALVSGLLALLAWALSRRIRRQALVHGLWVLALVKLVTPPIMALPLLPEWSLPSLALPEGPATVVVEAESVSRLDPQRTLAVSSGVPLPARAAETSPAPEPRPPSTVTVALPPEAPGPWSGPQAAGPARGAMDPTVLAWTGLLLGALVVASLTVLRIVRFRRALRLSTPAAPLLRERVDVLAKEVGLRHAPPVRLLPGRVPPMLWPAAGGPLLLLPAALLPELSDEERDTLVVHELAHVRRRDHWVRFLELAATTLFWWYPVTWWVRRALRRAEERCCDEWVLRIMPHSGSAYARGLLKSLDLLVGEPDPLPVGASGAGPVHDLESRLKEIVMTTRPKPELTAPTRLALAVVALLGLAVFPTQAQPPAPDEEAVRVAPSVRPAPPAPVPPVAPAPAPGTEEAPATPAPPPVVAPAPLVAPVATPALAPAPAAVSVEVFSVPRPRPVVAPAPAVAPVDVPAPAPSVAPAPAPVPAQAPAAGPLAAPGESPEDEAELLEIEEQQRHVEAQRRELRRKELTLAKEQTAREAAAQEKELQAEVERLRAARENERATKFEQQARAMAARMEIQRRDLELELARMEDNKRLEKALQSRAAAFHAAQRAGEEQEAAALRAELQQIEQQHVRMNLAHEEQQIALQRETLEVEQRARAAEMEMQMAAEGDVQMQAETERQQRRLELERGLHERELEIHEAEQAAREKELEIHDHESAGRTAEAEAARAQAEQMRQETDVARRSLQEERLLQATRDLRLQMESQLEALRQIRSEGAEDGPEVGKEIARLEAALEALRR